MFLITPLSFDAPSLWNPYRNIRTNFILSESKVTGLHHPSSLIFVVGCEIRMCFETQCVMVIQGYPRSLILAPIESAYAISYWSSIVTLVLYLAPFQRYCGFPEKSDPTPIHPNFRGVPFGLDRRCCGSGERRP